MNWRSVIENNKELKRNAKSRRNRWLLSIFHFSLFIVHCFVFSSCQNNDKNERKIDMTPTFSPIDKNPLGMYVANQLLKEKFKDYEIQKSNKPFNEFYKDYTRYDYSRNGNVYCVMAQQF